MEQLSSFFRFSAPPIVALVFIYLSDYKESWKLIHEITAFENETINFLSVLIGGTGIVITLGFIISSIAYASVNFFGLRSSGLVDFRGKSLIDYFWCIPRTKWDEAEYKIWKAQNTNEANKGIAKQISNRWNMTMANLNSLFALLIAIVLVYILKLSTFTEISNNWKFSWVILFVIFLYNFYVGYRSVKNINTIITKES